MNEYVEFYMKNNGKKITELTNTIIIKNFPWITQMYHDDFYSIAGEVLWDCSIKFDDSKGAKFETYLINCLVRKFKTRITYMNRQRRNNGNQDISLDLLVEENDVYLINLIASNEKVETDTYSDKMINYLKRLSKLQRKVLFAISEGYSNEEIKERLKISSKELTDACTALRSYRNVSLLY